MKLQKEDAMLDKILELLPEPGEYGIRQMLQVALDEKLQIFWRCSIRRHRKKQSGC